MCMPGRLSSSTVCHWPERTSSMTVCSVVSVSVAALISDRVRDLGAACSAR